MAIYNSESNIKYVTIKSELDTDIHITKAEKDMNMTHKCKYKIAVIDGTLYDERIGTRLLKLICIQRSLIYI